MKLHPVLKIMRPLYDRILNFDKKHMARKCKGRKIMRMKYSFRLVFTLRAGFQGDTYFSVKLKEMEDSISFCQRKQEP